MLSTNSNTHIDNIISCYRRLFEKFFENNTNCLFLQYIYRKYKISSKCSAAYLTTFAIKRDIFQTFFEYTSITVLSASISLISDRLLLQKTNLLFYLSVRLLLSLTQNSDLTTYLSAHRSQFESASLSATKLTTSITSISTQLNRTRTVSIRFSAETVYSQSV